MKQLFFILLILALMIPVQAFPIFSNPGTNYIRWTWTDDDTAIYRIVLDGGSTTIQNITYATIHQEFIQSDLDPGSLHSISITDDIGDTPVYNSSTTLPSNQDTQWTDLITLLNTWWYLLLISLFCVIGMVKRLGIFLIVASIISLIALYLFIAANTINHTNPLIELPFLIYIVFFVIPLWLCFGVKGGVFK